MRAVLKVLIAIVYGLFAGFVGYHVLVEPDIYQLASMDHVLTLVLGVILFLFCAFGSVWNIYRVFQKEEW